MFTGLNIFLQKIELACILVLFIQKRMEDPQARRKKKDKAKDKKERNGGFSTKHVRISASVAEKSVGKKLNAFPPL